MRKLQNKIESSLKQNGDNSNRLSPLGGKDDEAFAVDMNSFYSCFDKHKFRFGIDIIIFSKTGGNIHIKEW